VPAERLGGVVGAVDAPESLVKEAATSTIDGVAVDDVARPGDDAGDVHLVMSADEPTNAASIDALTDSPA